MTVDTYTDPNYTTQTATEYKGALDGGMAVHHRLAGAFAPHESATPDMKVVVDAGQLLNGTTLTEVAQQSTATITAPVTNPRIDRIVVDATTGAVSVIAGTEAASPSAPALTSGKLPIAQVALATSTTTITNDLITDERAVAQGILAYQIQTQAVTHCGTTGGSSTAFTAAAAPAIADNTAKTRIRATLHTAAGATPTLAVNGLTALPIKYRDSAGALQDLTSTQGVSGWSSDFECDGTNWVMLDVPVSATQFASSAENAAGTVEDKAVDPLGIREALNATGSAPIYACRAWVNFNGTGTVAIRASGNVSSITDNGTGDYAINFTTALPDANYSPSVVTTGLGTTDPRFHGVVCGTLAGGPTLMSTTQLRVITGYPYGASLADSPLVCVNVFR